MATTTTAATGGRGQRRLETLLESDRSLNRFALVRVLISMAGTILGYLAFTWSTVVLLGGYVTDLQDKDFWCLILISLIEATRIFNDVESEDKPFVSVSLYLREILREMCLIFQFRKWRPAPPSFSTLLAHLFMPFVTHIALLLVLIWMVTPAVFLVIPSWRLRGIPGGLGAGGGKHGGGLHGSGGGGENSQGGRLNTALVIFYMLVLMQGFTEVYLILSTLITTNKPYLRRLQQEYNFPDWGAEALGRYLGDAVEKCKRSPESIRDWNLFRHASKLLGKESWEDYVDGLRVLGILVKQGLFRSGSSQSQCVVASRPKVDKLIDTLADVDVTRSEARELAATVVAGLADSIQLARFPGAIQCVASLLETTHGHDGGEGATTASNELVLQGLTILDRLALDHHNCREICSAPGLLPKITAPLYSHTLIQEVIVMPPRASVVSRSLRVVHRLIRAPGETGARLRREICADEQAVSNIEGILGLAVADEAAVAAGEQAMLASKRRRQGEMVSADVLHMETRFAGLPHPPYEEMIVQALTEMRNPSGSSRRTISMYIADHFSGIDNDDLLSYNLYRLVSQGHLRRVRGTGNYVLERSVEHEKTLGDLQMLGMEILTELALDSSLNLSERTKRNLINTQLRTFLACEKGTEPVNKVQTSGRTLALLLHCCLPNSLCAKAGIQIPFSKKKNSLPITDLNDNICHLTRILDDQNNKIIYRTIAAWILEGLCAHHDIDDQIIKDTVLPKVVTKVLLSCDKARGRIKTVTKNRGPQSRASQRTITSPGDDEEKQNGQGALNGADDEKAAITELQEALLSLTLKLCKVIGEDIFAQVVQNEISGKNGTFALILKTIIEQNNRGKPTPNSLRIVKLCGQIAVSMMQCDQHKAHMDHSFVVSVTKALENMSELESSMLVTGTNCRMKKTIRPLLFEIEKELKNGLDLVG